MLRRLLAAGGASVGIRPMLATAYAANAVSVSVPLAGPAMATAFTFRRFTRQGADAPLVGWSLLAGGVISSAAAVLIVVGGELASGNILVTAITVPGGVLAVAVLVAAVVVVRRPRLRDALERLAGWMLRQGSRMLRRPAADPGRTIRPWAQRLGSLHLPPSRWITATGLALPPGSPTRRSSPWASAPPAPPSPGTIFCWSIARVSPRRASTSRPAA